MLRSQNSNCLNWQLWLVGLFFIIIQSDARAVNVSNTWTMPQEGLNVFYRFFRDRISWFEADAVCQFHHANLVTVDNSFQFDATRDLLRELDVNDIVWIGLMRPQSSDRFMWSGNSRPLVADTGYWAESLPLMDAPLCAVIDPIRDYRWHALRCGGPETASFLCEMPVPSWADACNLKDLPNLTLQYMADTASIELIRNCQEEGLLRTMCRGKQDRERAMHELVCPRERLEAQRINDITNSHFKSLQIINSIPSDNNENNDIELLPMEVNYGPHYPEELQTEKNTVQRLIEQFNVDELMQADEPTNMETVSSFYKIPGLIPKPVKKSGKKVLDYNKKSNSKEKSLLEDMQKIKKPSNMEDIMMGDQPLQGEPELTEQLLNEEVSNEILEPLPHIKKTNIHKEDMEKMEKEAIALKKNMQKTKEMEYKKLFAMKGTTVSTTTTEEATTTEESKTTKSWTTTAPIKPLNAKKEEMSFKEKQHYDATTSASVGGIGHPIHPQQQPQQTQQQSLHNQQLLNEDQHPPHNNKEAADNSHFIPPMLLVKSHYVPPANKHGHNEHEHEHEHHTYGHHLDTTSGQQTQQQHQILNQTDNNFKETTIRTTTAATMATTTIPLNLDLEKTTLKSKEDTLSLSSVSDSSLKAITADMDEHKNLEYSNSKEMQTTMTATTSHPHSYTNNDEYNSHKPATVAVTEITSIKHKETNKNEQEMPDQKITQTTNENAETTATANLLTTTADKATEKTTENFFEMQTTEATNKENAEKLKRKPTTQTATEITTTDKIIENLKNTPEPDNNNKLELITENRQEEKEGKDEENEKQLQTDKKETIVKTTEILGISMAELTTTTTTATTEDDSRKAEKLKTEAATTIATLIDKTTTTITTPITIVPTTIATASKSLTTTTTVKPITTTTATTITATMPQNEVKSTETSVSATKATTTSSSTTISTTNTNNNNENNRPTNTSPATPTPSSLTTIAETITTTAINTETETSSTTSTINLKTLNTKTDIETETVLPATEKSSVAAAAEAIEIATQISTSTPSPEITTRNFLKSTTEMPFKPNRRRSLTKPETVSYMKKILG